MTDLATTSDAWQAAFEAGQTDRGEPAWLGDRRAAAFARFRDLGFPSPREEAWRTTNTAPIARTAFGPAPGGDVPAGGHGGLRAPATTGATLVFVNGRAASSDAAGLPEGVEVSSLGQAVRDDPELVRRCLGEEPPAHAFRALNEALWQDGAVIRLRPGADLAEPIHLRFLARPGPEASAVHPLILILAERGSRGAVVESWHGDGDGTWLTNAVTRIVIEANARIDHLKVEYENGSAFHVSSLEVAQAADSRFFTHSLALGAKLARNEIDVRLDAPGAECFVDGLYLVDGDRHVDHQTQIDHAKPHGTSHQLYKGVLGGKATAAFSGRILVRPDAQKTDARQANHNLLLSRQAVADSKPQLEIFADDVKCAHGATVGRLDEDAIFYLRSRGLAADDARRLLVKAFAGEVPARIEHPVLREHAQALLEGRLPGGV